MSWDQGLQEREEVDPIMLEFVENKFEELNGYRAELQYITWFGLGKELFCDFGPDNDSIKLTRS